MADVVIGEECYGSHSSNLRKRYVRSDDTGRVIVLDETERYTSIAQFFRSVFLPQGYPESVSDDYLIYQLWDTIQAFASSITGTLASQALLKGIGVGDENATVLAATMTWLLKDGTSMVGRVVFAWLQGTKLDSDAKRWRLFADITNDVAIFLEILAPYLGVYFTAVVCVAGVAKSIVGVSGGATRASLTLHQARRNNMADVAAKDGSQETIVNLAALLVSLLVVPVITGKPMLIWALFIIFTIVHLYANYSAVTSVVMETFNQARYHIIVKEYMVSREILSLREANYREPVLRGTRWKLPIKLGTSFENILNSMADVSLLRYTYSEEKYLLSVDFRKGCIYVVLDKTSGVLDQLKACYQAELINYACDHYVESDDRLRNLITAVRDKNTEEVISLSYQCMAMLFPQCLEGMLQEGWVVEPSLLGPDEWRAMWDFGGLTQKKGY
ncbi:RUS family member 1-like [Liolophura sinensis]|uniref:RUS family member 1-like n=1 Tax=Liolophura sinensis TaxID=3198878 RepID=UPI0031580029